jgi:hypothetical protein
VVEVEAGCRTRVGRPEDCSLGPLLTLRDPTLLATGTFPAFTKLFDNYIPEVGSCH